MRFPLYPKPGACGRSTHIGHRSKGRGNLAQQSQNHHLSRNSQVLFSGSLPRVGTLRLYPTRSEGGYPLSRRYLWAIGLGVAVFLGAGAAVFAAGPGTTQTAPFSWVDSLASHLGISTTTLKQALQQTALDRVQALLQAGRITQAQATQMEADIKAGKHPLHFRGHGMMGPGRRSMGVALGTIAQDLNLTPQTLLQDLGQGQTLSQIITAQGKTASDIEAQLKSQLQSSLDSQVSQGRMTSTQETTILGNFDSRFQTLLTRTWPSGMGQGWNGPNGSGGPGSSGSMMLTPPGSGGPNT